MKGDVDGGWAWLVLSGASLGNLLMAMTYLGGIFNVMFLEVLGASKQSTAWIMALQSSLMSIPGPLASLLIAKFGVRVTCMIGAALGSLGFFLTYFATSFWFVFVTFGLMVGFGFGLAHTPYMVVIGYYFKQNRNLAYGVVTTSAGIGTMVLPPLIKLSNDYYGWRGCMLILSGVYLNMAICASTFKPRDNSTYLQNVELSIDVSETTSEEKPEKASLDITQNGDLKQYPSLNTENEQKPETNILQNGICDVTKIEKSTTEITILSEENDNVHCSLMEVDAMTDETEVTYSSQSSVKCDTICSGKLAVLDGSFLLLCINIFLLNAAMLITYVHFPNSFVQNGATDGDIALHVSIIGISNIVCRFMGGVATNHKDINEVLVYVAVSGIMGAVLLLCPLLSTTPGGRIVFALLFGLYGNLFYSLLAPVTIKMLRLEDLPVAFGIESMFCGIGGLLGPPVAGWLYDVTDAYVYSFYLAGSLCMLSTLLMMGAVVAKGKSVDH